jgi:hypothetical protein
MDEQMSDMPSWAKAIWDQNNQILGQMANLNATVNTVQHQCNNNREDIDVLMTDVQLNSERVNDLDDAKNSHRDDLETMKGEVDSLRREVKGLRDELREDQAKQKVVREDLNEQIDRSLRDHITFHGIPKEGPERSCDETTHVLCKWLAANTDKDYDYYDTAIERAHRGPRNPEKSGPPSVFCKIRWRVAEKLRWSLRGHAVVELKDKYCQDTQTRRNQAMLKRKDLRKETPDIKCHVAYPARVMVKKHGEERYNVVTTF